MMDFPNRSKAFADVTPATPDAHPGLLGPGDPAPIDWVNRDVPSPILLVCEHAGQAVPSALNGLGLASGVIDGHIGWDIGAEPLARAIASRLQATLIVQRYSRLVIDCNRPPGSEGSIPETSDGQTIPGNMGLVSTQHDARRQAIFDPMDDAITAAFDDCDRTAVFSIHSFTPHYQRRSRPWDAGFLTRRDMPMAEALLRRVQADAPKLTLAINNPYQIDDTSDWFIPHHAEARGLRHTLIEVRNDYLQDRAGVTRWADMLARAIAASTEAAK